MVQEIQQPSVLVKRIRREVDSDGEQQSSESDSMVPMVREEKPQVQ